MKKIALLARDPKKWVRKRDLSWEIYLNHYDNIGNLVWTYGIFKALHTPQQSLTLIDPIKPEFSVEEINERFDHIVFSFANLIDPNKLHRIEWLTAHISRLKIPLTVCSVGVQSRKIGDYGFLEPIKNQTRNLFSKCLDHGVCIGTRGDFTSDCLSHLGFANHVKTIGCPSFFINGTDFCVKKQIHEMPSFKVVFNDTDDTRKDLFSIATSHFKENFHYVTQGFPLLSEKDPIVLKLIADKKLHLFGDYHSWSAFLATFDLSISSRIHGTVMALLAGIPAVIVTVDARTQEMASFLGIPQVLLHDLQDIQNASDFYKKLDFREMNAKYPDLLRNYTSFLSENGLDHFQMHPKHVINAFLHETIDQTPRDDATSSLVEFPIWAGWLMQTSFYRRLIQAKNIT
jgi:hypothetical protein